MSNHPRAEKLTDLLRPYTLTQVAESVGATPRLVRQWKTGRMPVYHTYIEPLVHLLGVDRNRFIDACFATSGCYPIGP